MSKLNNKIKKKTKMMICVEHKCQVKISIVHGKMVFYTCCKKFENIIKKAKDKLVRNYLIKGVKRIH